MSRELKASLFGEVVTISDVCFSDRRCDAIRAAWPSGVIECERIFEAGTSGERGERKSGVRARLWVLQRTLEALDLPKVHVSLRATEAKIVAAARAHVQRIHEGGEELIARMRRPDGAREVFSSVKLSEGPDASELGRLLVEECRARERLEARLEVALERIAVLEASETGATDPSRSPSDEENDSGDEG